MWQNTGLMCRKPDRILMKDAVYIHDDPWIENDSVMDIVKLNPKKLPILNLNTGEPDLLYDHT